MRSRCSVRGCVSHGLPQTRRIRQIFPEREVAVIGLHTVFEHHAVMTPEALRVFVHEYRFGFPIGIDRASSSDDVPSTMRAYGLRGTPSLPLIDREGRLRLSHFGQIEEMQVGAAIGQLLAEAVGKGTLVEGEAAGRADGRRCALPNGGPHQR